MFTDLEQKSHVFRKEKEVYFPSVKHKVGDIILDFFYASLYKSLSQRMVKDKVDVLTLIKWKIVVNVLKLAFHVKKSGNVSRLKLFCTKEGAMFHPG